MSVISRAHGTGWTNHVASAMQGYDSNFDVCWINIVIFACFSSTTSSVPAPRSRRNVAGGIQLATN
jgi:hypothetical protein